MRSGMSDSSWILGTSEQPHSVSCPPLGACPTAELHTLSDVGRRHPGLQEPRVAPEEEAAASPPHSSPARTTRRRRGGSGRAPAASASSKRLVRAEEEAGERPAIPAARVGGDRHVELRRADAADRVAVRVAHDRERAVVISSRGATGGGVPRRTQRFSAAKAAFSTKWNGPELIGLPAGEEPERRAW